MAWQHMVRIADLENVTGEQKLVLFALATRACITCGFVWSGSDYLARKARRGETTIKAALRELKYAGLIDVHAYSRGGRGRATEFILLPRDFTYAPAPCSYCLKRRESGRHATGMTESKPVATRPVFMTDCPKPVATRPRNGSPRDPHSVINTIQLGAARQSDPPASPPGAASPPCSDNPSQTSEDARRGRELFDEFVAQAASDHPPDPNTGSDSPL